MINNYSHAYVIEYGKSLILADVDLVDKTFINTLFPVHCPHLICFHRNSNYYVFHIPQLSIVFNIFVLTMCLLPHEKVLTFAAEVLMHTSVLLML